LGFQEGAGDVIEANRILAVKVFVLLISMLPLVLFIGLLALLRQLMADPNRDRFPVELLLRVGAVNPYCEAAIQHPFLTHLHNCPVQCLPLNSLLMSDALNNPTRHHCGSRGGSHRKTEPRFAHG
jgi:hypothetical protein